MGCIYKGIARDLFDGDPDDVDMNEGEELFTFLHMTFNLSFCRSGKSKQVVGFLRAPLYHAANNTPHNT